MTRILFVDDEKSVLDGLRNLLWRYRKRWEMEFALSGQEALEKLRAGPFQVVITDMRMPGMDGAELLTRVREEFPQAARLVLSGHADRESVMRCVPVAHQFLSKPCDPGALPRVIERATQLQELVGDGGVRAMTSGIDKIPSPSRNFWQLSRALADPETGLAEVARLVEEDPGVAAKVLQLVNSAYFGLRQDITSVERAVTYLGAELVRNLVMASHLMKALEELPWASPDLQAAFLEVQQQARMVGRLAQRIGGPGPKGHAAYAAGLLHDIGKLVAASAKPLDFEKLWREGAGAQARTRERQLFGFGHAEAGAFLLGLWGLPNAIVDTAGCHHNPSSVEPEELGTVGAVHVAAALIEEVLARSGGRPAETVLDDAWVERVGATPMLPQWRELAEQEAREPRAAA